MTLDPRLERTLPTVLADLGSGGQPDYADALLARTARVRQRPAWTFPERWLPMDTLMTRVPVPAMRWRLIALAVLLLVALVAAAIVATSGTRPQLLAPFGPAQNGLIALSIAGDISVGDPSTRKSTPLVTGPEFDFRPGFSPDGSMIAFLRRVDPAKDYAPTLVVVAKADGSGALVVTTEPLELEPSWWSWTPDGRSIAVLTKIQGAVTLEVFDALAARSPRVVDPKVTIDSPAFGPPDGKRLVFRGRDGLSMGLYTMNADGSDLRAIVAPYVSKYFDDDLLGAAWSPDGTKIAFQRAGPAGDVHIEVIDADGSGAHTVGFTQGDVLDGGPVWSPDGTRILFARLAPDRASYSWTVVGIADGAIRQVGPKIDANTGSGMIWSPDGKRLLAVVADGRKPFYVDPATGATEDLTWTADTADWQRTSP